MVLAVAVQRTTGNFQKRPAPGEAFAASLASVARAADPHPGSHPSRTCQMLWWQRAVPALICSRGHAPVHVLHRSYMSALMRLMVSALELIKLAAQPGAKPVAYFVFELTVVQPADLWLTSATWCRTRKECHLLPIFFARTWHG